MTTAFMTARDHLSATAESLGIKVIPTGNKVRYDYIDDNGRMLLTVQYCGMSEHPVSVKVSQWSREDGHLVPNDQWFEPVVTVGNVFQLLHDMAGVDID